MNFLTNVRKSEVEYLQIAVDGGVAEVVVVGGHDVRLHLAPVVLDPELELGRVEDDLQVEVLPHVDVDQLLLGDSLKNSAVSNPIPKEL